MKGEGRSILFTWTWLFDARDWCTVDGERVRIFGSLFQWTDLWKIFKIEGRCLFYGESTALLERWIFSVRSRCSPRWFLSIEIFLPNWVSHWKSKIIHRWCRTFVWCNDADLHIRCFRTVRSVGDILRKTWFRSRFWLLLAVWLDVENLTVRHGTLQTGRNSKNLTFRLVSTPRRVRGESGYASLSPGITGREVACARV